MKLLLSIGLAACLFMTLPVSAFSIEPLKIGVADEPYPPFTWKEPDGKWKGFEIDLSMAICAAIKRQCVTVNTRWDGLIEALTTKKIDMIMSSMVITDERRKVIDFTIPYYSTGAAFMGSRGSVLVLTRDGMKGKTVGVQDSTTHAADVQSKFGDVATIRTYPTQEEANDDLVAKHVDVVFADKVALAEFLKKPQASGLAILADVPPGERGVTKVGAGLRKEDKALTGEVNAAIATLLANGDYDRLAKPYFDFDIYGLPRK